MCGILGYLGNKNGVPLVHEGLKALSYRGYDSWGIAAIRGKETIIQKEVGDISKCAPMDAHSPIVIGHTRWATHGGVTDNNAHPHTNNDGTISVVHNGIIENYHLLKEALLEEGYTFTSETDTEVIPHLIDFYMKRGKTFKDAFARTLKDLKGSYAILAMHALEGIHFARNGSPLILGIGDNEMFVSSDIPSFLPHTKRIITLEDGDYGSLTPLAITNKGKPVKREESLAHWDLEVAKKGTYEHFMLKEIEEQPLTIRKALNQPCELIVKATQLMDTSTIIFVGCGTSYNACSIALTHFVHAGKQAMTVLGSEFESVLPYINNKTLLIAVSQSGETADVIDSIKSAQKKGAKVISIVNSPSSTIARLADLTIPMNCGPELCVLSTKSCTSQIAILMMLAFALQKKDIGLLKEAADTALHVIKQTKPQMQQLARKIANERSMFVIGRKSLAHVAREAALKIKEVSYIHAEGMPAGELKHGTIAVVCDGLPVIVFADNQTRAHTTSNAMEVKARGAFVIGIDSKPSHAYDYHISIPDIEEATPLIALLPVQLLSYYLALERKCDPDKPRNLAKSVTVR
ncbi:glutamine--fructose-6-phosphate transaminase (isomerizing) [Candidatus Woesearchaeota archaeon]|nr:glutamine--fructose-6-phosphate transaminase (isomerizing) [Candidatus Woesearchaeota archaeon]